MEITGSFLSLPPHISTSWKNIVAIFLEDKGPFPILAIELINGSKILIPGLSEQIIETIFETHAKYLEESHTKSTDNLFLKWGGGNVITSSQEGFSNALQHNSEHKDAPNLPLEILRKVANIAKVLGLDDPHTMPKPEPHCNCVYCQIARSIQAQHGQGENEDEEVKDEELRFRSWDIKQANDNQYIVSNPEDEKEYYNVYLGNPVGCTCGHSNCEHIHAVLNSY